MLQLGESIPIINLRRVLGVSLQRIIFPPVRHAWHLLPWFFHGQLTDFPLENYSTLCVVVCGHRWFTVFHYWNMDHYRRAETGEFPESMEVYPDETPWTVPEIRQWYHSAPLRTHCSATDSVRRIFLIRKLLECDQYHNWPCSFSLANRTHFEVQCTCVDDLAYARIVYRRLAYARVVCRRLAYARFVCRRLAYARVVCRRLAYARVVYRRLAYARGVCRRYCVFYTYWKTICYVLLNVKLMQIRSVRIIVLYYKCFK